MADLDPRTPAEKFYEAAVGFLQANNPHVQQSYRDLCQKRAVGLKHHEIMRQLARAQNDYDDQLMNARLAPILEYLQR